MTDAERRAVRVLPEVTYPLRQEVLNRRPTTGGTARRCDWLGPLRRDRRRCRSRHRDHPAAVPYGAARRTPLRGVAHHRDGRAPPPPEAGARGTGARHTSGPRPQVSWPLGLVPCSPRRRGVLPPARFRRIRGRASRPARETTAADEPTTVNAAVRPGGRSLETDALGSQCLSEPRHIGEVVGNHPEGGRTGQLPV